MFLTLPSRFANPQDLRLIGICAANPKAKATTRQAPAPQERLTLRKNVAWLSVRCRRALVHPEQGASYIVTRSRSPPLKIGAPMADIAGGGTVMIERLRDPKWLAIGCAAVVVGGLLVKFLEPAPPEAIRKPRAVKGAAAPELGKYELAKSSWSSPRRAARAKNEEDASELHTKIEERRWSGLCVTVQRDK